MSLAVLVLWWFFRRMRATLMVGLAIPLCLSFAFLVLDAAGRTLNVISLAGLAFATGLVLDAAIVVLENILPPGEDGRSPLRASDGAPGRRGRGLLAPPVPRAAAF